MSVNNSIVKEEKKKNIISFNVGNVEVKLSPEIVRKYLVNGNGAITDQEVNYFIQLCRARGLNPFVKDAYLIKFGNQPAAMVVSKDAIERRAIKNEKYDGKKIGLYIMNSEGVLEKRDNTILLPDEKLLGAYCEVYRTDWKYPVKIDVNLNEYIGKKNDGTVNSNWTNRPVTMLTKVAKVQALREAFIEDLQGMYESDELPNIPDKAIQEAENKIIPDNIENTDQIEEAEVVENYDKNTGEIIKETQSDESVINDIFG